MPSTRHIAAKPFLSLVLAVTASASIAAVNTDAQAVRSSGPQPLIDPPIVDSSDRPAAGDVRKISAPDQPYQVFVVQENSFARCGPSSEDYRTDPLSHGQPLKVYVEAADGWLGVRSAALHGRLHLQRDAGAARTLPGFQPASRVFVSVWNLDCTATAARCQTVDRLATGLSDPGRPADRRTNQCGTR